MPWPDKLARWRDHVFTLLDSAESLTKSGSLEEADRTVAAARAISLQVNSFKRPKLEDAINAEIMRRTSNGRLVNPVTRHLDAAEAHAERGEIVLEEQRIYKARMAAEAGVRVAPVSGPGSFAGLLARRVADGKLRRGSKLIELIKRDFQLSPGAGVAAIWKFDKPDLELRTDRVIYGDQAYKLDGRVSVSVEVDGELITSSRPTLTRMAAGSILPGTALIPGLAFQKTTTTDTREGQLMIVHPDWSLALFVAPEYVSSVRPAMARLGTVVREMERAENDPTGSVDERAPASDMETKLANLERVAALHAAGSLTDDQAAQMRSQILGS